MEETVNTESSNKENPIPGSHHVDFEGGKFLTFLLKDEEYGLEILKVREIMGVIEITPVPQTPVYVKGVINLRGQVIPVIDLRLKFGLAEAEYDQTTVLSWLM